MNVAEPDDEIMMFILPSDLVEIGLGHTVQSVFLRFKIATFGIRHSRQPASCVAQ